MQAKILWVALLAMLACVQARITMADVQEVEWEAFKLEFNKNYDDEQEDLRHMEVFQDNKQMIEAHNRRWAAGEESYEMGINQFTDLEEEEFQQQLAGHGDAWFDDDSEIDFDEETEEEVEVAEEETEAEEQEEEWMDRVDNHDVDWRRLGAVTPVQHQGHFNNSWAFAAAGVVESRQFLANGKLVVLSKQNLVDCCRSKHKRTLNALKCIKKKGGIDTEAAYPYRGITGKCKFSKKKIGAKVRRLFQSAIGNEKSLARNVAKGPVAALISMDAIRFFKSGVFHNNKCGKDAGYAVLIVGYGHCQNGGDFWLLKTSLGKSWGEKGYMRLARNRHNLCGIANSAYYPRV